MSTSPANFTHADRRELKLLRRNINKRRTLLDQLASLCNWRSDTYENTRGLAVQQAKYALSHNQVISENINRMTELIDQIESIEADCLDLTGVSDITTAIKAMQARVLDLLDLRRLSKEIMTEPEPPPKPHSIRTIPGGLPGSSRRH